MGTGTIAHANASGVVTTPKTPRHATRGLRAALGALVFAMGVSGFGLAPSEAAAETRTLNLYYTHTKKSAKITFKKNGRYLKSGLKQANKFLADWRTGQQIKIDPKLLDVVWEVYQKTGSRKPIHVVSSYRSPKTNAMLRRTRGGQAKKSQHMVGKALDFFIPGQSAKKMRALGLKAQAGGVGYYPKSGFVHLDTGRVRHWPRMNRSQLTKVFPKGGTLHVPSDGKALPGYKQAQADYKLRMSGKKGSMITANPPRGFRGAGGGLLAGLFGGDDSDSGAASSGASPTAKAREVIAKLPRRGPQIAARPGASRSGPSRLGSGLVPTIRTVSPDDIAPLPGADVPTVDGPVEATDETLLASLPDLPPAPSFRPGTLEPTTGTLIADAVAAAPKPVIRPGDAGQTAIASAAPLALAYAPSALDKPAARALARIGKGNASDVAKATLKREGELNAAIKRGRSGGLPSGIVADDDKELTEEALRLAFARTAPDVSARRTALLTRVRAAKPRWKPTKAATRAGVEKIDPGKLSALAAALRRQAADQ